MIPLYLGDFQYLTESSVREYVSVKYGADSIGNVLLAYECRDEDEGALVYFLLERDGAVYEVHSESDSIHDFAVYWLPVKLADPCSDSALFYCEECDGRGGFVNEDGLVDECEDCGNTYSGGKEYAAVHQPSVDKMRAWLREYRRR